MKINVGCGWECREGWINVDNTQKHQRVNYPIEYMNAVEPWPYEDDTFDAILSEHMIEHLPEKDGEKFLAECYRTMKHLGVIRITCPDRGFAEYIAKDDEHPYVINYAREILNRQPSKGIAKVVSERILTGQGHVWVPYGKQLIEKIRNAGFRDVETRMYGRSSYEVFNGIEKDNGIREYETLCVEGIAFKWR